MYRHVDKLNGLGVESFIYFDKCLFMHKSDKRCLIRYFNHHGATLVSKARLR